MTVENLLIKFSESMKIEGLSSTTMEAYLSDVRKYFVDKQITESQIKICFSEDSIIKYFENLIFKQDSKNNMVYKKTYLNKKFSSFSKFLFYLTDQKIISSNFLEKYDRKILFGPLDNDNKKIKYLDQKTLFKFTDSLIKHFDNNKSNFYEIKKSIMILVLIFTGLRVSELVNIKVNSVDLSNLVIRDIQRKGGTLGDVVPIDKEFLKNYLSEYLYMLNSNNIESLWLFPIRNGKRTSSQLFYNYIIELSQKNLGFKVHPHMIRHSFATALLSNGASTAEVRDMLGHKTILSTERYEHINKIKRKYNLIKGFYSEKNNVI
ncbi:MAG: tyrosine-type recombinase/integrase [Deltaproteobacteria bacterium TMED126]|nr:tyrosine-type recombinase/integrase [Deltaproteobacteria bacterium TMED126]|tara:strand:- start:8191 stop:9150 length:960 start_codon:yes stop_codon:yes gene_type:complete